MLETAVMVYVVETADIAGTALVADATRNCRGMLCLCAPSDCTRNWPEWPSDTRLDATFDMSDR